MVWTLGRVIGYNPGARSEQEGLGRCETESGKRWTPLVLYKPSGLKLVIPAKSKKEKSKSFVTNELCEIYKFEIKVKYCSLTCPKLKEEVLIFISHSQSHLLTYMRTETGNHSHSPIVYT